MFIRKKNLWLTDWDYQVGAYATGLSCCPSVIKTHAVRMVVLKY